MIELSIIGRSSGAVNTRTKKQKKGGRDGRGGEGVFRQAHEVNVIISTTRSTFSATGP